MNDQRFLTCKGFFNSTVREQHGLFLLLLFICLPFYATYKEKLPLACFDKRRPTAGMLQGENPHTWVAGTGSSCPIFTTLTPENSFMCPFNQFPCQWTRQSHRKVFGIPSAEIQTSKTRSFIFKALVFILVVSKADNVFLLHRHQQITLIFMS